MVASQIGKNIEPAKRFNIINHLFRLAGNNKVGFDNSVFLSEQHHADKNISLAYYVGKMEHLMMKMLHLMK